MIPINLTLQGFRSYANPTTFSFGGLGPGLYFMTGENLVEPDLGGNATGKSSLWDGMCWCLFGKTSRNLSAGSIHTWYSGEKTKGSFEFETRDHHVVLTRTWSPNTLTWSLDGGKAVTVKQEELEELLGLNITSFLHSVLIAQHGDMFFDLGPTEKSNLFGDILDLDVWIRYSNTAKDRASALDGHISDITEHVAGYEGQLVELKSANYDEEVAEWELNQGQQKSVIARQQQKSVRDKKKAVAELAKANSRYKLLREELDLSKALTEKLNNKIKKAQEGATAALIKNTEMTAALKSLVKEKETLLKTMEQGGDAKCPTCCQIIDKKLLGKEIQTREELVTEKSDLVKKGSLVLDEKNKKVRELKADLVVLQQDEREIQDDIQKAARECQSIESLMQSLERDAVRLTRDLSRLENEINPWKKKQEDLEKRVAQLQEIKKEAEVDLQNLLGSRSQAQYWVKGFKEVRLFLIEEALIQFEIEVNNALSTLGMPDWRIEFAVDSQNKNGSIRKGFAVVIHSPYTSTPVPWEAWSGGETQRLRLAGTMGLSSLILGRNNITCNHEVWDEPSKHLSVKGVEQLLETLHSRAVDQNKQIWVIDHTALAFGGFRESFVAIKDKQGTSLHRLER